MVNDSPVVEMPVDEGHGRDCCPGAWREGTGHASCSEVMRFRQGSPARPPEIATPPRACRIGPGGNRDACPGGWTLVSGLSQGKIITTALAWINPRSVEFRRMRRTVDASSRPHIFATGKPLRYILIDGITACGCQHRGGRPEQRFSPYWLGCNDRGGNRDGR